MKLALSAVEGLEIGDWRLETGKTPFFHETRSPISDLSQENQEEVMNQIIDERRTNWFWIDNEVVDRFGPQIGAYGLAVSSEDLNCKGIKTLGGLQFNLSLPRLILLIPYACARTHQRWHDQR